jgi:hypothetical protein
MDEREHPRLLADQRVACRIGERATNVLMYDLSRGGCMAEAHEGLLLAGHSVVFTLTGAPDLGANVVWVNGKCFGAKFSTELHAAIVEHYGYTPSGLPFEALIPRDRFGRPLPARGRLAW